MPARARAVPGRSRPSGASERARGVVAGRGWAYAVPFPVDGPGSGGRRIVSRKLLGDRGDVMLRRVLAHHTLGGELLTGHAQRVLHLLNPTERDVARVPRVEQRHDVLLEEAVQLLGI